METQQPQENDTAIQIPSYSEADTSDITKDELLEPKKDRNPYIILLLILLCAGIGIFLYSYNPAYDFIAGFFLKMRELGFLGVAILTLIFTFWLVIMLPVYLPFDT